MKSVLFVYNPQAGKGTLRGKISDVLEVFRRKDMVVTVFPTVGAGDAYQLIKQHGAEFDRVICAGGDGTLHEAVHGLMEIPEEKRPGCGYIPTGTVNDFANGIKLPKRVIPAAEVAAGDRCHAYDVGEMNGQYFSYVAAFGAFTDVSYETKQEVKNVLGHLAYMIEGMKRLPTLKSYQMTIRYEDQEVSGKFLYGMITNSDSVGGFKHIVGKDVKLNDGVFEVVLIKEPRKPMDIQSILTSILMRDIEHNERIITFKTNMLTIESENEIQWTLDGEFGGKHKKVEIVNKKEAVQILVNEGRNLEKLEKKNEIDEENEMTKEIEGEILTISDLINAKLESEYAEKENSDGISEN